VLPPPLTGGATYARLCLRVPGSAQPVARHAAAAYGSGGALYAAQCRFNARVRKRFRAIFIISLITI